MLPTERVGFSGNDEIPQVFDTDPTKPITSWKVSWTTARAAAKVQCRFHDLRHAVCTRLLERGTPFATVATIMGWSPSAAMRMAQRYSHIGQFAATRSDGTAGPRANDPRRRVIDGAVAPPPRRSQPRRRQGSPQISPHAQRAAEGDRYKLLK